jgi:hypothetical protein
MIRARSVAGSFQCYEDATTRMSSLSPSTANVMPLRSVYCCGELMHVDRMEKFYQMQIEEEGIVGPEGPGTQVPYFFSLDIQMLSCRQRCGCKIQPL